MEVGGRDAFYDQVAKDASVICIRSTPLKTMAAHSMWLVASSLFLTIPSHLSLSPVILCIWRFGSLLTLCCGFYFNGPPKTIFVHRKPFVFWKEMKIGVSCFHHPIDDAFSQLWSRFSTSAPQNCDTINLSLWSQPVCDTLLYQS